MPHDSFECVSGAVVMEAVSRSRARNLLMQSASPQRGRPAPSAADIVGHEEFVLNHIGIWPYLLMEITGQLVALEEIGGVSHLILACNP